MSEAFYQSLGDGRLASTPHTAGPWSAESQHMGPPAALLGRALEQLPAARPARIVRVTVEILGPVPVAELAVTARIERPGRSVELLSAELSAGGRSVARAGAWRIAQSDSTEVAGLSTPAATTLPAPDTLVDGPHPRNWGRGYLDSMRWRSVHGYFDVLGPAVVWASQAVALVDGEEPTGLQRLLTVADSGSGLSACMDPREWLFINSELTVHVHREPVGEWIGMDARTVLGADGTGTAFTVLHDQDGPVGRGAQALLVRPQRPR